MIKQSKIWMIKANECSILDQKSKLSDGDALVEAILCNRGLLDGKDRFMTPAWVNLHDPFLMKDMDKAVDRICKALQNAEKICVYGDYDADGITATALLVSGLRELNGNVDYYIPDRMVEGYGLNCHALQKIADAGVSLIISVDCGISGYEEALLCNRLGIDLLITDHHEPPETIPQAYAVVNPKQKGCQYPHKGLAGVGVAFKLLQALWPREIYELRQFLDLVALGTVADIVPILDENRFIVSEGLQVIQEGDRIGIRTLLDVVGANGRVVDADTLGYTIGPRVNAAGRIGRPQDAVRLLIEREETAAQAIALNLDQWNRQRQQMEADILAEVLEKIEECQYMNDYVIVVEGKGWHPGVVGIVSSRITEQFARPSVILTYDEEKGITKGSGRSILGFNLYEALRHCQNHLLVFGGHEQAAGLTLNYEHVAAFRQSLNAYAKNLLTEEELLPSLSVDMVLPQSVLTLDTANTIGKLAPFGEGNRAPMFLCRDLIVGEVRAVGSTGDHLKLRFNVEQGFIDGIAFSFGDYAKRIVRNDRLDVVFSLEINRWNGRDSIQLMIRDMKVSDLADNLISMSDELIHIDAFETGVLTSNEGSTLISTKTRLGKNVSEHWARSHPDYWHEFCQILQTSINHNEPVCVIVNTREQCRHIKQMILFELNGAAHPLVLHRRMDEKTQEDTWHEFIAGRGNPLVFTGYGEYLKKCPHNLRKVLCLYPFYAQEHFNRFRAWVGLNNESVDVFYLFSEEQLLKNMQLLRHLYPEREILSKIYKSIRYILANAGEIDQDLIQWSEQIQSISGLVLLSDTIMNSITVFSDLGLICSDYSDGKVRLQWLGEPTEKLMLEDSSLYAASIEIKKGYQDKFMNFRV